MEALVLNMSIFLQVKKLWSDLKHFQVKGCVFLLLCVVRRTTVKRKKKKTFWASNVFKRCSSSEGICFCRSVLNYWEKKKEAFHEPFKPFQVFFSRREHLFLCHWMQYYWRKKKGNNSMHILNIFKSICLHIRTSLFWPLCSTWNDLYKRKACFPHEHVLPFCHFLNMYCICESRFSS